MQEKALELVYQREKMHWKELLHHHFPPTIVGFTSEESHSLREFGLVPVKYENIDVSLNLIYVFSFFSLKRVLRLNRTKMICSTFDSRLNELIGGKVVRVS